MRVLLVSGIWPPDVGGPASHAPELAAFLQARGHVVEVVTTADRPPPAAPYHVRHVSRRLPPGVRHAAVVGVAAAAARHADVVYATSMLGRAALAAQLARRPLVAKITGDEAYERAKRWGRFDGDLDDFQRPGGGLLVELLRRLRTLSVRRASHLICPSDYLCRVAVGWGMDPESVEALPNPAPDVAGVSGREDARAALGLDGFTLGFAGRLTEAKGLDVLLDAVSRLPGTHVLVAGDGGERTPLEERAARLGIADRVRFLGGLDRDSVLRMLRAVDVAVLTSRWENFPHSVVEALAVGTPVIASAVGGVPEIVTDGVNGLLVEPGDVEAFAEAVRRLSEDAGLRGALAAAAAPSVARFSPDTIYGRIVAALEEAAR